jgi:beta-N-acetylhexosaminidase
VRKLLLLSIALISTATRPAISGAVKVPPKRTAKPGKPVEKPVVRRWLSTLTLDQKVAQLIVIPFYGEAPNTRSKKYLRFVQQVRDERVGGLILINRSNGRGIQRAEPYALAAFLNRMQRMAKIPLIVAGDFERGASMRVDATTLFPHAMAFAAAGDPLATKYMGEIAARDSRALGIQWIFFPVADVNSNPDKTERESGWRR